MSTKGERHLAKLRPEELPSCDAPLPEALKAERVFSYAHAGIDLATPVAHMLLGADACAETLQGASASSTALEKFVPAPGEDPFYSSEFRKALVKRMRANTRLCDEYERLIKEVIAPQLAQELAALEDGAPWVTGDGSVELVYQYPPTLRIQPRRTAFFRREHRDAEYGHQPGELNFWLALTDTRDSRATLWVESAPDLGDFHPLRMAVGEMVRFWGTSCFHKAPPNETDFTRVSLDFRVAPVRCYDRNWALFDRPVFVHEMRALAVPVWTAVPSPVFVDQGPVAPGGEADRESRRRGFTSHEQETLCRA